MGPMDHALRAYTNKAVFLAYRGPVYEIPLWCSVRLADLIRTRNAIVFLLSLAEFSLSCGKQTPFWNHLKICFSSGVNRRFIYFIHYDMTPRLVISLMRS